MSGDVDAEERELCAAVCQDLGQEPPSALKVCRMQCTNTIKVLLEATRNTPDLVAKQLIDYLVVRTTDVRQQLPWCTTDEITSWMTMQLRERFLPGQLWTMRKVHLLLHQLLWRGSVLFVNNLGRAGPELIDAGYSIELMLRTRQDHATSARLVAAMERACAAHTPHAVDQYEHEDDTSGNNSNNDNNNSNNDNSNSNNDNVSDGTETNDAMLLCGASMLAHLRNHIAYLAALHAYRTAYGDLVDLPEMRLIHYKVRQPLGFKTLARALHDTIDLLRRTAADDARAGSFCPFALAVVHSRVDVDAQALYTIAVDMLTKLLVKLYEQARALCLKYAQQQQQQQQQQQETSSVAPDTAADTAAATSLRSNDSGSACSAADGMTLDALRRDLRVLLGKWRDMVSEFNDTVSALAGFCAAVQQHCGSTLQMTAALRTLPTTALCELHTYVHKLQDNDDDVSVNNNNNDHNVEVAAASNGHGGGCAAATTALLLTVVRAQIVAVKQLQPSVDSLLLLAALRELLDEDDVDARSRHCARAAAAAAGGSHAGTASLTDHDITGLSSCTSDTMRTAMADGGVPTLLSSPSLAHKSTSSLPPPPPHEQAAQQPRQGGDNGSSGSTSTHSNAAKATHDTTAAPASHDDAALCDGGSSSSENNNGSSSSNHTCLNDSTNGLNTRDGRHGGDDGGGSRGTHGYEDANGDAKIMATAAAAETTSSTSLDTLHRHVSTTHASRNELNTREPRSGAYILRRTPTAATAATSTSVAVAGKTRTTTRTHANANAATTTTTTVAADGGANALAVDGDDDDDGSNGDATLSRNSTEVIDVTSELSRKCTSALQSLLQSDDVVVVCNETCSCNAMKLADRFQILRDTQLGTGSFGTVYRAWDEFKGSYLAAKEIAIDTHKDRGVAVREVLKEYTILTELSHPNIVRVVAFMVVNNIGRIFMEWMPSGSLQDVLRRSLRGALREPVVSRYIHDVLAGLTYLHSRGILHRDVKPANMLLTVDGVVKLTDFGSSFVFGDNRRTLESLSIMGTAPYMAPEAVQGVYSPATDIWALGCSVVELVTGMTPWSDLTTGARIDTIPLIYKIGSLNDTTELDRPHTHLIADVAPCAADTTSPVTTTAAADDDDTHAREHACYNNNDNNNKDVASASVRASGDKSQHNNDHQHRAHPRRDDRDHGDGGKRHSSSSSAMATGTARDGGGNGASLVHVSSELRDFLQRIFVVDRKRRATAEELLEHPFVQKYRELWSRDGSSSSSSSAAPAKSTP